MSTKRNKRGAGRAGTSAPSATGGGRPDVLPSALDPKTWWRTLRADQFGSDDVRAMEDLVARVTILGRPDWYEAVEGDPAAAIRLAASFLPLDEITLQVDLAMTVLVLHAVAGDAAAAATVAFMIRNVPGRAALHQDISKSWLIRNVLFAYGRKKRARS